MNNPLGGGNPLGGDIGAVPPKAAPKVASKAPAPKVQAKKAPPPADSGANPLGGGGGANPLSGGGNPLSGGGASPPASSPGKKKPLTKPSAKAAKKPVAAPGEFGSYGGGYDAPRAVEEEEDADPQPTSPDEAKPNSPPSPSSPSAPSQPTVSAAPPTTAAAAAPSSVTPGGSAPAAEELTEAQKAIASKILSKFTTKPVTEDDKPKGALQKFQRLMKNVVMGKLGGNSSAASDASAKSDGSDFARARSESKGPQESAASPVSSKDVPRLATDPNATIASPGVPGPPVAASPMAAQPGSPIGSPEGLQVVTRIVYREPEFSEESYRKKIESLESRLVQAELQIGRSALESKKLREQLYDRDGPKAVQHLVDLEREKDRLLLELEKERDSAEYHRRAHLDALEELSAMKRKVDVNGDYDRLVQAKNYLQVQLSNYAKERTEYEFRISQLEQECSVLKHEEGVVNARALYVHVRRAALCQHCQDAVRRQEDILAENSEFIQRRKLLLSQPDPLLEDIVPPMLSQKWHQDPSQLISHPTHARTFAEGSNYNSPPPSGRPVGFSVPAAILGGKETMAAGARGWRELRTPDGGTVYYNILTNQSTLTKPIELISSPGVGEPVAGANSFRPPIGSRVLR